MKFIKEKWLKLLYFVGFSIGFMLTTIAKLFFTLKKKRN